MLARLSACLSRGFAAAWLTESCQPARLPAGAVVPPWRPPACDPQIIRCHGSIKKCGPRHQEQEASGHPDLLSKGRPSDLGRGPLKMSVLGNPTPMNPSTASVGSMHFCLSPLPVHPNIALKPLVRICKIVGRALSGVCVCWEGGGGGGRGRGRGKGGSFDVMTQMFQLKCFVDNIALSLRSLNIICQKTAPSGSM